MAEKLTPYVLEDFEEGVRVARHSAGSGAVILGTVEGTEGKDTVIVTIDNGLEILVDLELFRTDRPLTETHWSKPLQLDEISEGTVISLLADNERYRTFATVTSIDMHRYITIHRTHKLHTISGRISLLKPSPHNVSVYTVDSREEMEELMCWWEVEG